LRDVRTIVAALLLTAVLAAPAQASPLIGIGAQDPGMFSSPLWRALQVPDTRIVVSWDALHRRWERAELDSYMTAAKASGARVLLSLGAHRGNYGQRLPSVARFAREFRRLHRRYPWVKDWVTWNEANHCGQPSCHHPEVIARYYNAMRRACHGCQIVGADVLDNSQMVGWIRRFRKVARGRNPIWGLHNYIDANRFYERGTRALLRAVRGQVWFTETGGIVARHNASHTRLKTGLGHAAKATRWVFRLAGLSPRVRRIYFYDWSAPRVRHPHWDSGLVDRRGRARPAYHVLASWLRRHRHHA
jgi:hypothetical protein